MECVTAREAISARLDGEDPGVPDTDLGDHLAGCADCRSWEADLGVLHRAVRVREAEPVPDLTATILARAAGPRPRRTADAWRRLGAEPISGYRWALLTVALTQLVLAAADLVAGGDGGVAVHAARELGAFDVALSAGLVAAALQPARAWGLLPVVTVLGFVLSGTAVFDVLDGSVSSTGEARHVLDLAGVALVWTVARVHGRTEWVASPA